ncbi:NADPH-dependent FMN reductase [Hymenobacter chitinivorans]|uniref:NAD(P)H-dependent FMN reductase n=1 Tax=Hymenobacter chitinivorans DSM 11115 TaxID=1121954 RepID=A0A2M9B486_9BACT|nr:NADPH-dependent FMN reductase [Hymenobacter chitinivorans]PJJ52765.1 NAD(P)H-dependent FMN reductase [Hymenobacter chitinivorans DSM 11115]
MHLLAFGGSLRPASTTGQLLRAAAALAPASVRFGFYEGLADLPHFSPELDAEPLPRAVTTLRQRLAAADGILFCTPEYAYGMPGAFKNALDWTVSTTLLTNKPVAIMSASPSFLGGDKAHAALQLTLTALNTQIVEEASLLIPGVRTKLSATGEVTDAATRQQLQRVVAALGQACQQQG